MLYIVVLGNFSCSILRSYMG
ncbi:hypothetical protein Gotur_009971, partial [Gossypium turneri]